MTNHNLTRKYLTSKNFISKVEHSKDHTIWIDSRVINYVYVLGVLIKMYHVKIATAKYLYLFGQCQ